MFRSVPDIGIEYLVLQILQISSLLRTYRPPIQQLSEHPHYYNYPQKSPKRSSLPYDLRRTRNCQVGSLPPPIPECVNVLLAKLKWIRVELQYHIYECSPRTFFKYCFLKSFISSLDPEVTSTAFKIMETPVQTQLTRKKNRV